MGKPWHRRIYYLNGQQISPEKVSGFLHTARKNLGSCMGCGDPVRKGQQYVMLNIIGADPLHFKYSCMTEEDEVVAVGTRRGIRFGVPRCFVICASFKWNGHEYVQQPKAIH